MGLWVQLGMREWTGRAVWAAGRASRVVSGEDFARSEWHEQLPETRVQETGSTPTCLDYQQESRTSASR